MANHRNRKGHNGGTAVAERPGVIPEAQAAPETATPQGRIEAGKKYPWILMGAAIVSALLLGGMVIGMFLAPDHVVVINPDGSAISESAAAKDLGWGIGTYEGLVENDGYLLGARINNFLRHATMGWLYVSSVAPEIAGSDELRQVANGWQQSYAKYFGRSLGPITASRIDLKAPDGTMIKEIGDVQEGIVYGVEFYGEINKIPLNPQLSYAAIIQNGEWKLLPYWQQ